MEKISKIKKYLLDLGLIKEKNIELYSSSTRDRKRLNVWIDKITKVIFINNYYVGDDEYISGYYKEEKKNLTGNPTFERKMDLERRLKLFLPMVKNKIVADIGCKEGEFLKKIKQVSASVIGVDIDESSFSELRKAGIICYNNLKRIEKNSIDIAFFFHSFEHFDDPILMLKNAYNIIKPGGSIYIEVPHAKDILLNDLFLEEFKLFTLWSQHLILHTKESLSKMVSYCGYNSVKVTGIQRYPLSNHLYWLKEKKPGGHKSKLNLLDNNDLHLAYEKALKSNNSTDTLLLSAKKPIDKNRFF